MSNELIERLKSYIPSGDGHNSQYANDLADAVAILEAKAAPVGDLREAFRSWCESIGYPAALMTCGDLVAFQAGAAYQRAQQPQSAEAVAYIPVDRATGEQWHPVKVKGTGAICDYIPLYTTQQPSAGVVMPERKAGDYLYSHAWNNCLDEFARLNGKEVGRG